jgi:autotransporter-associated beta strand protein
LDGANTYTGATTISSGAVIAANSGALGTSAAGTTVESGAALQVSGGITLADNITIAGSGTSGDGAIRSLGNGQNTLSGGITLSGNARINVDAPIGSATTLVSLGSAGFTIDDEFTDISYSQSTTNLTLTSAVFAEALSGAFNSIQNWSSVSNLGLRLSAASNPDLTFDLALFDTSGALLRTYQGDTTGFTSTPGIDLLSLITGSGSLSQVGYMEFKWGDDAGGVNVSLIDMVSIPTSGMTISGSINAGTNVLTLGSAAGGSNSVATGLLISGAISGAGNTYSNTTTSLVLDGAGVVELTGNNTFTGDIRVLSGALRVGSGASTNALGVNADLFLSPQAEFAVAANVSAGSISADLGSSIKLQESSVPSVGSVLTINGAGKTNVISGDISGVGGLTLAGNAATRLELTGNNTYSRGTVITGGTLVAGSTGGNQALGSTPSLRIEGSGSALLLMTSNQVRDNVAVTLSGGTIRRGANVNEVFGSLTVTSGSFLDFGSSNAPGTLRFDTYTASALLTVEGFMLGNKLQFASNFDSSLLPTGGNLSNANFSFSNGFTTGTEDGFFTITAIPEPSTYVAAAGLLAFMLWSFRRQRRKI